MYVNLNTQYQSRLKGNPRDFKEICFHFTFHARVTQVIGNSIEQICDGDSNYRETLMTKMHFQNRIKYEMTQTCTGDILKNVRNHFLQIHVEPQAQVQNKETAKQMKAEWI